VAPWWPGWRGHGSDSENERKKDRPRAVSGEGRNATPKGRLAFPPQPWRLPGTYRAARRIRLTRDGGRPGLVFRPLLNKPWGGMDQSNQGGGLLWPGRSKLPRIGKTRRECFHGNPVRAPKGPVWARAFQETTGAAHTTTPPHPRNGRPFASPPPSRKPARTQRLCGETASMPRTAPETRGKVQGAAQGGLTNEVISIPPSEKRGMPDWGSEGSETPI